MSNCTRKLNGIIWVSTDDDDFYLDEILYEVDTSDIITYLLAREIEPMDDGVKARKLIVALLGLPSWYYSDKARMAEEIGKLF